MKLTTPAILALFTAVFAPTGAEWCDFDNDWWNNKETYCSDGCCLGSCCDLDLDLDLDEIHIDTNYAVIAGGCVGAFIFIVMVITLICACAKSGTRQGRVIAVVSPVGVSTVATTATGGAAEYGMYTSSLQSFPPPPASNQLLPPPPPADYKLPLQS